MKIRNDIKIREEDGFYLLINLDSESIIKGYPSFFKINDISRQLIEELKEYLIDEKEIEDVCQYLKIRYKSISLEKIEKFILFLIKNGVCYE